VSANKTPTPQKTLLSSITPHPDINVGDRMLHMQRTEMKKPIFWNPYSIYKTLKLGERGMLLVRAGPLKHMGVFSADTCKVIERNPSLCDACLLETGDRLCTVLQLFLTAWVSVTQVCDASVLSMSTA